MRITRRDFLKYCSIAAGALGLTATDLLKMEKALALPGGLKVIWLNGQACTGCTVSLANTSYYATIQQLTLDYPSVAASSETLDIAFMETLSGVTGDQINAQISAAASGAFALCVEGAIPTGASGEYCEIGYDWTGIGLTGAVTIEDAVVALATRTNCAAVIGVGTCACFGGIPAGFPNPTTAKGITNLFKGYIDDAVGAPAKAAATSTYRAVRNKLLNIPGCPPNPNWIVGTIAYLLANNLQAFPSVDSLRRPRTYYGERVCNYCDRFTNSKSNNFVGLPSGATTLTVQDPNYIGSNVQNIEGGYCLKKAGCKGSRTKSDCGLRKWHSSTALTTGVNWCVGAGAPCQGCTQDKFPDGMSPFHYIR